MRNASILYICHIPKLLLVGKVILIFRILFLFVATVGVVTLVSTVVVIAFVFVTGDLILAISLLQTTQGIFRDGQ